MPVDEAAASPRRPVLRSFNLQLALVAVAALVVRVGYVLLAKRDESLLTLAAGDQIFYSGAAEALAGGRGFVEPYASSTIPAADHPPLTAIVAAPASLLPGDSLLAQRLTMCAIGVVTVVVIGLIGRRIAGPRCGLIAAGVAAVYPALWVNDGLVMSESVGAATIAAAVLLAYRFIESPSIGRAFALGLTVGVAGLARAESLLLLPFMGLPLCWWFVSGRARQIGRLAVICAGTALALAPWVLPNLFRFENPVLLSSNDGLTLLGANCDAVYEGEGTGLWSLECLALSDSDGDGVDDYAEFVAGTDIPDPDDSVSSAAQRSAAFEYITDNVARVPAVAAVRIARLWGFYAPGAMVDYNQGESRERWASWAGYFTYLVLLASAVAGALVLRRRRVPLTPLLSQFVAVTVTAALFYGLWRFRIPAEIAIIVLAAAAVDELVGVRRGRTEEDLSAVDRSAGPIEPASTAAE
ncbi:MAG: hypothetical protein JJLCMIEE_01327 [Acidimicrobiales bacterium]|nr:hypothetical protein [Acidimicrobiales bacterium]